MLAACDWQTAGNVFGPVCGIAEARPAVRRLQQHAGRSVLKKNDGGPQGHDKSYLSMVADDR